MPTDPTIVSGSSVEISNAVSNYIVEDFGEIDVLNGGSISDSVAMNSGYFWIDAGGSAQNISATMAGEAWFFGGTGENVMMESGGYLHAYEGSFVNSAVVRDGGYGVLYNSAVASNATVSSGGSMLMNGGLANNTVVTDGGYLIVQNKDSILAEGVAQNTTVLAGGSMRVASGGTIQNTAVYGFLEVLNGQADGTVITGGSMCIAEAATIHDTTLNDGVLELKGAIASNTTINGGQLTIGSATVSDVVFTGGSATFTGTIVHNVQFGNATVATLDSTSMLSGRSVLMDGVSITIDGGSVLFDTAYSTSTDAQIQGLAFLEGDPMYELVANSTPGTYLLATNAATFNSIITFGSVTLSLEAEEPVMVGDYLYSLALTETSDLVLTIALAKISYFTGRYDGGENAMLAKSINSHIKIYGSNGEVWGTLFSGDDWEIIESGDFNGDKKDDFLRINEEGYVVGEMSNGDATFTPQVLNLKSAGWDILGIGDFNGNGTDDVLIANPTGASETVGLLGYWESGVTWTLINGYSAEWEVVATGDFNADGKCDMLWRNSFEGEDGLTYNAYCTWIVEPPEGQSDWRMVSVANPDDWNFLCAGDFDGDKSNDIAMINAEGVVGIWGVNDGWLSSWSILSAVSSEWTLAGVDDFNGDGTDDIAWCNSSTGLAGYWQVNDYQLTGWQNIAWLS